MDDQEQPATGDEAEQPEAATRAEVEATGRGVALLLAAAAIVVAVVGQGPP